MFWILRWRMPAVRHNIDRRISLVRRFTIVCGLVCLLPVTLPSAVGDETFAEAAAATPLIPRQILFGNPEKSNPRISPDGTRLSYLAPIQGVLNIWVGPIEDPATAKPITTETRRPIRYYGWAFTNQHIFYVQDS